MAPSRVPWTVEEDQTLRLQVQLHGAKNWKLIATAFNTRKPAQCAHRWSKVLNPMIKKGSWTAEEDEKLRMAVKAVGGPGLWAQTSKHVPGRNGKQCRERWHNHLDPNAKKTPWTKEEDEQVLALHKKYGNRWTAIARALGGRTENAVKNRWNARLHQLSAHAAATSSTTASKTHTKSSSSPKRPRASNSISLAPSLFSTLVHNNFTPFCLTPEQGNRTKFFSSALLSNAPEKKQRTETPATASRLSRGRPSFLLPPSTGVASTMTLAKPPTDKPAYEAATLANALLFMKDSSRFISATTAKTKENASPTASPPAQKPPALGSQGAHSLHWFASLVTTGLEEAIQPAKEDELKPTMESSTKPLLQMAKLSAGALQARAAAPIG